MVNNITIAMAKDITTLCDDVNMYPVDLSGTVNTLNNWLEKCSYFRPICFLICCQSFIHVIFSWVQIGRSAIFGRRLGSQIGRFFCGKKYSSLMSKLVYLHHRRSL